MRMNRGSLVTFAASLLLIGCARAPAVNILGSFFPAWMICLTLSVIFVFVIRLILVRFRLETEIGPLALFYPCVVVFTTCLLWLIFFH